jgi:hypothetical protein
VAGLGGVVLVRLGFGGRGSVMVAAGVGGVRVASCWLREVSRASRVAAWDSSSRSLALRSSGVMAAEEGREMGGGREVDGG